MEYKVNDTESGPSLDLYEDGIRVGCGKTDTMNELHALKEGASKAKDGNEKENMLADKVFAILMYQYSGPETSALLKVLFDPKYDGDDMIVILDRIYDYNMIEEPTSEEEKEYYKWLEEIDEL